MATKKEKRARGLAKHEAFLAQYKADGLAAQQAAKEREKKADEERRARLGEVQPLEPNLKCLIGFLMGEEAIQKQLSALRNDTTEYEAAKCKTPHQGSVLQCNPSWDGFGYVCVHAMIEERRKHHGEQGI